MDRGLGRTRDGAGPVRETNGVSVNRSRAQTTIDFMIGAGVFLLVVGFVLGVIPSMIDPFSDSQESTLVADRLSTQISEGMLGDPDRPTVLNQTCVNAFFGIGSAEGSGCPIPFDESITDLSDRLGVDDRHSINVTIKRDIDDDGQLEILTSDGDGVGGGSNSLAIGPQLPELQSQVAASRTAFIDGVDVSVVVTVW